jgi:hypothetical protein
VLRYVDIAKFGIFGTRFVLRDVLIASSSEANLFLSQLTLHLHTSGPLLLITVMELIFREGNGADRYGLDILVRLRGLL